MLSILQNILTVRFTLERLAESQPEVIRFSYREIKCLALDRSLLPKSLPYCYNPPEMIPLYFLV